jgi:hypothetical protein
MTADDSWKKIPIDDRAMIAPLSLGQIDFLDPATARVVLGPTLIVGSKIVVTTKQARILETQLEEARVHADSSFRQDVLRY